ncbi:MAG TPA: hypothetical protein VMX54_01175 [Vicinamibacteria bacterium]|nr:hypothetical protein [Vicinamibacteria bacterium]
MRCRFLREEQVKSCQAAPFRKSLVRASVRSDLERCSGAAHLSCPLAAQSREAHPSPAHCPFLHESLMQFCSLTPLPRYVPWSESPELRCAHDGHRYCELFREAAPASALAGGRGEPETHVVERVPLPGWLLYAPNHLWLDPGDDGVCHLGIDAFASRLLGPVERLALLTVSGTVRPAVVLTVRGVDLTLVFPLPLTLIAANGRLRSRLDRLTADPYGLGWLFEARWRPGDGRRADGTLREGAAAREWMATEVRRAEGRLQPEVARELQGA